jgi:hypothetical protein
VIALEAYAADCRLFGSVDVGDIRLTDFLNANPELRIQDARLESLADGHVVETPELAVARDELCAVIAAGPRGDAARRVRTYATRFMVDLGPYEIVGIVHSTSASDPLGAVLRRAAWVPLTDAIITYRRGHEAVREDVDILLVNRNLTSLFRAAGDRFPTAHVRDEAGAPEIRGLLHTTSTVDEDALALAQPRARDQGWQPRLGGEVMPRAEAPVGPSQPRSSHTRPSHSAGEPATLRPAAVVRTPVEPARAEPASAAQPVAAEAVAAEPRAAEPEAVEPAAAEPAAAERAEPVALEPAAVEPAAAAELVAAEPVAAPPASAEPVAAEPVAAQPAAAEPAVAVAKAPTPRAPTRKPPTPRTPKPKTPQPKTPEPKTPEPKTPKPNAALPKLASGTRPTRKPPVRPKATRLVAEGAAPGRTAAARRKPVRTARGHAAPTRPAASRAKPAPSTSTRGKPTPVTRKKARSAAVPAAFCPYCALLLTPPPVSSRRCARCRQRIIVKRVDGRAVYLTEAAVLVFENERRRIAATARLARERERWLRLAASAGAPAERISRLAAAPLADKVVETARTLYLGTVDRAFRAAKKDHDWGTASRLRREQATALYRLAGSPLPPPADLVAVFREGVAAELRGIAVISRDAEMVSATCCDVCRADDRRIFRIAHQLRVPRLPHEGCPKGLCRCGWDLAARDRTTMRRYLRRRPATEEPGATDEPATTA